MAIGETLINSILKSDTALDKAAAKAIEEKVKSASTAELVNAAISILQAAGQTPELDKILETVYTLRSVADGTYKPKEKNVKGTA